MILIVAIVAIVILLVGSLTFCSSLQEAAYDHEYGPIALSTPLTLFGVFLLAWDLVSISTALTCVGVVALVMAVLLIKDFSDAYRSTRRPLFSLPVSSDSPTASTSSSSDSSIDSESLGDNTARTDSISEKDGKFAMA